MAGSHEDVRRGSLPGTGVDHGVEKKRLHVDVELTLVRARMRKLAFELEPIGEEIPTPDIDVGARVPGDLRVEFRRAQSETEFPVSLADAGGGRGGTHRREYSDQNNRYQPSAHCQPLASRRACVPYGLLKKSLGLVTRYPHGVSFRGDDLRAEDEQDFKGPATSGSGVWRRSKMEQQSTFQNEPVGMRGARLST